MRGLAVCYCVEQWKTSQLDSCGIRQELPSLLLRRLDANSA
jgi:hypothetical protein